MIHVSFALAFLLVAAQEPDGPLASSEPGWPQWRGPRRDGVSDEKGLLPAWPEGGPKLLWKTGELGKGWSSPIVAGPDRGIYISGELGGDLVVFALSAEGKLRWKTTHGKAWTGDYPGARATCAYRDGRLFLVNAHGRVACFDPATGKELWAVDILERFGGRNIEWAISEGLLVDGDRVIVTPGGRKAFMAALDVRTGATVWSGDPLPDADVERTGYASPLLVRVGGRRMLVSLALRCMAGVDADDGKLLWTFAKRTPYDASGATPVYTESGFFYTLPFKSAGASLVKVSAAGGILKAERRWDHPLDNCNGGAVALRGMIYGSGHDSKAWACIDAATGEEKARWTGAAKGSLIAADDRLYLLSETGDVVLAKPHPNAFEVTGRFKLIDQRRNDVWAHPVLLDGRLYLRTHDTLYCYSVANRP